MVQEVQQDMNMFKELDETEWIWYVERRLSYKTQIRDKEWWTASFCKLNLFFESTIPSGTYTSFDNIAVVEASNDVTLDDDKTKIHLTPWLYIMTTKIALHNTNINCRFSATLFDDMEVFMNFPMGNSLWTTGTSSAIFKAGEWNYIKCWLFTDTSLLNTNDSYMILSKIW